MKYFLMMIGIIFVLSGGAWAHDKWELASSTDCIDDDFATCNTLVHGQVQTHDLEGTTASPDNDWMVVETKARHSYEVQVFSANLALETPGCGGCVTVNRVDQAGTVLTPSIAPDGGGPANGGITANNLAVRWIGGSASQRDFIRVVGDTVFDLGPNDQYNIVLYDTTYFFPRWNQSGTQVTVLLIQNTTPVTVTGSIFFFNASGALLHTQPLSVPVSGLQVVSLGSIPALVGNSGSATVVHTGGYGALVGKSVALEPATGFSFDTPMMPIPR